MDQIQKCFMILEKNHVLKIVNHLVTAENMSKFGIMFLWNIINLKMEHILN